VQGWAEAAKAKKTEKSPDPEMFHFYACNFLKNLHPLERLILFCFKNLVNGIFKIIPPQIYETQRFFRF